MSTEAVRWAPAVLEPRGKTLVVVVAHADDAELNAGGLMARWSAEGGTVHIVMVTANNAGALLEGNRPDGREYFLGPEETRAIRHAEQDAAAAIIGAKVHYLDYPQRFYWDGQKRVYFGYAPPPDAPAIMTRRPVAMLFREMAEERERFAELLVGLHPDLVVTHSPLDVDPEHFATSAAVARIFRGREEQLAGVPLWGFTPGSSLEHGILKPPFEHIVDISLHFETKFRMLAAHGSQMTQARLNRVRARAPFYGAKIGVAYAEPYMVFNRGNELDG